MHTVKCGVGRGIRCHSGGMARFLIKLILNALALWITTLLVVGVHVVPYAPDTAAVLISYLLIALVVFVSLCGAVWTLWEKRHDDPWLRLLHRAERALVQGGIKLTPNSPPRKLAAQMMAQQERLGSLSENAIRAIQDWLLLLEALRYAPASAAPASLKSLQRDYKQLAWPKN